MKCFPMIHAIPLLLGSVVAVGMISVSTGGRASDTPSNAEEMARLVRQLGSEEFARREAATKA